MTTTQTEMTIIGTIKHSWRTDLRVTLYAGADGMVWAGDDTGGKYATDVPLDRVATAWSGPEWDLELVAP